MGNLNKAKHTVTLTIIKKYDLQLCREFMKLPELSEAARSYLNTL